jgi:hypothetical protein
MKLEVVDRKGKEKRQWLLQPLLIFFLSTTFTSPMTLESTTIHTKYDVVDS